MEKRQLLFVLLVLLLLLPGSLTAQVITGTITSEGKPLPDANVIVKRMAIGTSTDANGRYTLKLSPGTYDLIFSIVGHESKTITVALQQNEEKSLDVDLAPKELNVQEVVVVGGRASQRTATDSPLPIDVFSYQELVHTGQTTFDKMLQYRVPSFNTAQTPVNDATALLDPWEI